MALTKNLFHLIYGTVDLSKERESYLEQIERINYYMIKDGHKNKDTVERIDYYMIKDGHKNKDTVEFFMNRNDERIEKRIEKVKEYNKSIKDAYNFIKYTVEEMYNDGDEGIIYVEFKNI
uniref:Uncharacterized protein n=1 Tax=Trachysalambria curvirostris majanivirus TaxID=2984281 RepID=A0A9C7CFQ9_9VIRU|nr:MAG: hypothetical protein [Trachysalambria curvirostris majanivirus]